MEKNTKKMRLYIVIIVNRGDYYYLNEFNNEYFVWNKHV